jgi:hypothetical protein
MGAVIMAKRYRAIQISEQGFLTNEAGDPIVCPICNRNCSTKCSWLSIDNRVISCRDLVIGAIRPKPMRSFQLYSGPDVYNLDESIKIYQLQARAL